MAHVAGPGNGALPSPLMRDLRKELRWQQALGWVDEVLATVHGYVSTILRVGLFVGLLVCNGMVLLQKPEERATVRNMRIGFLGTVFFVLLLCSSIDGCFMDCCGDKKWIRPFKSALFLPQYCLIVLLLAPSADQYFGNFDQKSADITGPEKVLCDLVGELLVDAGLAWLSQYVSNILVAEMPPQTCPIMASASGYVLWITLYVTQPNLRMRIEYLSRFLGYTD